MRSEPNLSSHSPRSPRTSQLSSIHSPSRERSSSPLHHRAVAIDREALRADAAAERERWACEVQRERVAESLRLRIAAFGASANRRPRSFFDCVELVVNRLGFLKSPMLFTVCFTSARKSVNVISSG